MEGKIIEFKNPIKKTLFGLEKGEIFVRPSLGKMSFDRWKRGMKSYCATQLSTGKSYSCRVGFNDSEVMVTGMWEAPKVANDIDKLTPGILFAMQHKKDCLLFRFVEFTRSGKIKATNPLDDGIWTLDRSYVVTLIDNLKKTA